MATTLSHLIVRLDANIGNLQKKMTAAERAIDNMASSAQRAGKILTAAVTLPLAAVGGLAVKAALDLDKLKRGLEVSAGSADAAAKQLRELEIIARQPGLGFKEAIAGAVQLNTVLADLPNNLSYTNRLLAQFGNAIALTGGGKAELDRVIFQLGQIAASGRVLTQDLRPIITTAPAVAGALKRAFGTVDAQQIEKLGLSSQQFFDRLLGGLEELERAAAGPANSFENFTDSVFRAAAAIGDRLLPVVTPLLNRIADLLEKTAGLSTSTIQWAIAVGSAAAALGPLLFVVGMLTKAYLALKIAGMAALPFFGIGGPIALGLGALITIWTKSQLEAAEFAAQLDKVAEAADNLSTSLSGLTSEQLKSQIALVESQLANLRSVQSSPGAGPGVAMAFGAGFGGAAEEIAKLEERLKALKAALNPVTEVTDAVAGEFTELWEKLAGTVRTAFDPLMIDVAKPAKAARAQQIIERDFSTGAITVNAEGEFKGLVTALRPATEHMTGLALTAARLRVGFDNVVGTFKEGASRLLNQFGPQALTLGAMFDIVKGALVPLKPVIDALRIPLANIGWLLGTVLAPIIKTVLIPPLKLLATIATYVIEALGWLIEVVGKFIDKILPGNQKLDEFGQQMQDAAIAARRAIEAQEDLTETVKKLTDSIIGAVAGFKVAQYRFAATMPSGPATMPGGSTMPAARPGEREKTKVASVSLGTINIMTSGDGRETYRNLYDQLDQRTRGDADARALFHAFPAPA